jgi:hypothetical protein
MKLVLPIFVAAFVAFVLGWFAAGSFRARGRDASESVVKVDPAAKTESTQLEDPARHASGATPADRADSPPSVRTEERAAEALISEALRRYALVEIEAGWHETRQDALPEALRTRGFGEFEEIVKTQPREIGRRLAMRRTQEEQIASDDPFAVLAAIREGSLGAQVALVDDAKRFGRYFACARGGVLNGLELAAHPDATSINSGAVIQFPAGDHGLNGRDLRLSADVACITIAGAGMDRTLLRLQSLSATGKLDRLELRDLTLYSACDAIDLRGTGVWRAERVRFIGFDCGAGGCGVFDLTTGGLLELVSCRIEGGYGRNPGDGCLFDARGSVLLARFEDCAFDGLRIGWRQWGSNATVVFERCRMTNLLDGAMPVERDDDGLVVRSTSIELRPQDAGRLEKRDLAELFPAWIQPSPR